MPRTSDPISYKKCSRCRRDRQRCQPVDRTWPGQDCDRCLQYGYQCSQSRTLAEESGRVTPRRRPASRPVPAPTVPAPAGPVAPITTPRITASLIAPPLVGPPPIAPPPPPTPAANIPNPSGSDSAADMMLKKHLLEFLLLAEFIPAGSDKRAFATGWPKSCFPLPEPYSAMKDPLEKMWTDIHNQLIENLFASAFRSQLGSADLSMTLLSQSVSSDYKPMNVNDPGLRDKMYAYAVFATTTRALNGDLTPVLKFMNRHLKARLTDQVDNAARVLFDLQELIIEQTRMRWPDLERIAVFVAIHHAFWIKNGPLMDLWIAKSKDLTPVNQEAVLRYCADLGPGHRLTTYLALNLPIQPGSGTFRNCLIAYMLVKRVPAADLRTMVVQGMTIPPKFSNQETPLHVAIRHQASPETLHLLLESRFGIDINQVSANQQRAIDCARASDAPDKDRYIEILRQAEASRPATGSGAPLLGNYRPVTLEQLAAATGSMGPPPPPDNKTGPVRYSMGPPPRTSIFKY